MYDIRLHLNLIWLLDKEMDLVFACLFLHAYLWQLLSSKSFEEDRYDFIKKITE